MNFRRSNNYLPRITLLFIAFCALSSCAVSTVSTVDRVADAIDAAKVGKHQIMIEGAGRGSILITGTAGSSAVREKIEAIARSITGVKQVKNKIEVQESSAVTPSEPTQYIATSDILPPTSIAPDSPAPVSAAPDSTATNTAGLDTAPVIAEATSIVEAAPTTPPATAFTSPASDTSPEESAPSPATPPSPPAASTQSAEPAPFPDNAASPTLPALTTPTPLPTIAAVVPSDTLATSVIAGAGIPASAAPAIATDATPVPGRYGSAEEILRRVANRRASLGAYNIKAVVENEVAVLSGTASSSNDRVLIENIALNVPGVLQVSNQIRIVAPITDRQLVEQVKNAIANIPEVIPGSVTVTVVDGVVTLRGYQRKTGVVDQIIISMLSIPGIRDLKSEIRVGGVAYPKNFSFPAR